VARVAILIHGDIFEGVEIEKKYYSQIYGALMEIIYVYGIPIFFAPDHSRFKSFIRMAIYREISGKNDREMREKWYRESKNLPSKDNRVYLLSSIPYIGDSIAKNLLRRFGLIANIANASIKELRSVDKIGRKKGKNIFNIFHQE
jgi:ERCC4-type nuclease